MVVQGILQDLLGELVRLPTQELKLDLLNGHVLLGNLDVQPAALQVLLGLPLVVQAGVIGRVEMHIPWSKLGTEPTRLLIDRVLLLVSPQSAAQLRDAEEELAMKRKLARLRIHEDRRKGAGSSAEPTPRAGSHFFSKLGTKLLKNLQAPGPLLRERGGAGPAAAGALRRPTRGAPATPRRPPLPLQLLPSGRARRWT